METIPPQEPNLAGQHQPEQKNLDRTAEKIFRRLQNFTLLEIVELIAIIILIFNNLFVITVTVSRKPLLEKVLGARTSPQKAENRDLTNEVLPAEGTVLPVLWSNLGKQILAGGLIDQQKFEALYAERGGLTAEMRQLLTEENNGKVKITRENSGVLLNLFWALGLGQKNQILENGEIQDVRYGGAGKMASTAGWPLAAGEMMNHYSKHQFISLNPEQQTIVDKISKNIFRPCCSNAAHFPDCNHGMAMLGLLELMASQGINEQEMYKNALTANAYWFPNNYLTIASYFNSQGTGWNQVKPQIALSAQYSSDRGYAQLQNQITSKLTPQNGGGCGA